MWEKGFGSLWKIPLKPPCNYFNLIERVDEKNRLCHLLWNHVVQILGGGGHTS